MDQRELKKLSLLAEVACDYYERGKLAVPNYLAGRISFALGA